MQTPKQELTFFESIKCGLEEAIAWKNGQTTDAVIYTYTNEYVIKIRNQNKIL